MKTAWLKLLGAGFVGALAASGCVITTGDGNDDGEGGGTSTGGKATGGTGTGGKATGGAGTGGTSSGGKSTGGASTGGTATGGTPATGGTTNAVFCDPDSGDPLSTPSTSCEFEAMDLNGPLGACLTCLSAANNCCAELKNCYGDDPNNQCGFGGPTPGETEYLCYQDCIVTRGRAAGGAYDPDTDPGECADLCATPACSTIGNFTNELIGCMHDSCEDACLLDPAM